jgi:hypothetical protein
MSGAAGKHLLFDESVMSQTVIIGVQRVFDWEVETGGELLKTSSGVHQPD